MSTKMKGLLKGLRYISQIFDNEKEQEMEIGYPTDVKHVAHIGWDGGPSVNSPSWMNEFKPSSEASSTGNHEPNPEDSGLKDGQPKNSQAPPLPDMPRSSRRQSSTGTSAAVTSEQSDAQKRSRRHHSSSSASSLPREATGKTKPRQAREASQGSESPSRNPHDMPRKNRQRKSKDSSKDGGGSTRSRARSQTSSTYAPSPFSDPGCGTEPRFQSNEKSAGLEGVGEEEEKGKCNEI